MTCVTKVNNSSSDLALLTERRKLLISVAAIFIYTGKEFRVVLCVTVQIGFQERQNNKTYTAPETMQSRMQNGI